MHANLLEQLHTFQTIVEVGTYSKASIKLNKTVSSISYTISQLENQLELTLFDRSSYRPKLTEVGESLYSDSVLLTRRVERFSAKVNLLNRGIKTTITIGLDPVFPRTVIINALTILAEKYPEIEVNILHKVRETAIKEVVGNICDIGLVYIDSKIDTNKIEGMQIGSTSSDIVVSPHHPLALTSLYIEMADLENHRQIVLSNSLSNKNESNNPSYKTNTWTVFDENIQCDLVRKNLGWAYLHSHSIWKDLKKNNLVVLKSKVKVDPSINRLGVIWAIDNRPFGPLEYFIDNLRAQFPPALHRGLHSEIERWRSCENIS